MTNQPNNESTDVETSAQPGNNPVALAPGERIQLSAQDLAPRSTPEPGLIDGYGDDETITDKVRTALGRELHADRLPHLNVNTQ